MTSGKSHCHPKAVLGSPAGPKLDGLRRSRGFTLMEAVIVTGVMVVLVGGAVVSYDRMVHRAQARVEKQNQELIRKAIYEFYVDRGRYPENLNELTPGGDGRGYLVKVPVNPRTGSPDWILVKPQGATTGVFDVAPAGSSGGQGIGGSGR